MPPATRAVPRRPESGGPGHPRPTDRLRSGSPTRNLLAGAHVIREMRSIRGQSTLSRGRRAADLAANVPVRAQISSRASIDSSVPATSTTARGAREPRGESAESGVTYRDAPWRKVVPIVEAALSPPRDIRFDKAPHYFARRSSLGLCPPQETRVGLPRKPSTHPRRRPGGCRAQGWAAPTWHPA
jgi:hypothetical protein